MFQASPLNALLRGRCFSVLGGLCLLAAGLLGTPKTVQASCGDYLAHPSHSVLGSYAAGMDSRSESDAPVSPRPCNGPSCRRSDAPMPVPSPAPVRLLGERWATIFEFELVLPSAAMQFPALTEELCLSAFPARLDRPPKIG